MFWWAYQPKLLMHDQTVRLALKLHVTLQPSFFPVWHYDITFLAQVQWYNDMVWKNLFNFVSERSVWAGNVQNGPNVQQSKRRRIIELLKVQVFCIQVFGWILLEGQCFFNHFSISSTFLILFFLSLALQLGQGRSEVTTKIYQTENRTPTTQREWLKRLQMNCKTFSHTNLARINVIRTCDYIPVTFLKG